MAWVREGKLWLRFSTPTCVSATLSNGASLAEAERGMARTEHRRADDETAAMDAESNHVSISMSDRDARAFSCLATAEAGWLPFLHSSASAGRGCSEIGSHTPSSCETHDVPATSENRHESMKGRGEGGGGGGAESPYKGGEEKGCWDYLAVGTGAGGQSACAHERPQLSHGAVPALKAQRHTAQSRQHGKGCTNA